jgi:DOPA 4,5-dioxygenase
VYFDPTSADAAAALRRRAQEELKGRAIVHGLVPRPIGPHPLPMFEIDVPRGNLEDLVSWMMLNRAAHSVLVHPITGSDLADHRDHPVWIGKPLPLDLEFLAALEGRR